MTMTKEGRAIFSRAATASSVLTGLMTGPTVNAKAVTAAIAHIAGAGQKLDNQIHGTAVACIRLSMSVAEGGPASGAGPAVALMNAMPKGSRAKALAAWFEAFSNIRVKFDKGTRVWAGGVLNSTLKSFKAADPDAAMLKPFWAVEEADADPKAFILGTALAAMLKRAQKAADAGTLSADDLVVVEALKLAGKALLTKADEPAAPAAPVVAADPLELEGAA